MPSHRADPAVGAAARGAGQPTPDGHLREPELPRSSRISQPLQITEDDRGAQSLGQALDLLVQDLPIAIALDREVSLGGSLCDTTIEGSPSGGARRDRAATRRATPNSQLAIEAGRRIEPARLARTRKTAWKASSCVVGIAKDIAADLQHHRARAGLPAPQTPPQQPRRAPRRIGPTAPHPRASRSPLS